MLPQVNFYRRPDEPPSSPNRDSRDLNYPSLPPLEQTYEARMDRVTKFSKAVMLGRNEFGGHQIGNLVDLTTIDANQSVVFIGDLHGRTENLAKILQHNGLWESVDKGDTVLVLLGDIIHEESTYRCDQMDRSIQIMEQVMELKIARPTGVYLLLGNHDFLNNGACKFKDESAGYIVQSALYRYELAALIPMEHQIKYMQEYKAAIEKCGLVCVARGAVAVHAGPIQEHSLQEIVDAPLQDRDAVNQHSVVQQATWNRWMSRTEPGRAYGSEDVVRFLNLCLQDEGTLLVGHSPRRDNDIDWHWELMPNHHIIFAAHENVGYAVLRNGAVEFMEIGV